MTADYTPTRLIAVDVESSGLNPERHIAVEVAWWDLSTGERGDFVPAHNPAEVLATGQIEALRVSHYVDRISLREQDRGGREVRRMWEQFAGPLDTPAAGPGDPIPEPPRRILAAVNPHFDAAMLSNMFAADPFLGEIDADPAPWHYRLRDLGSYAAGVWGLPLDHPPLGLREVCERLGVKPGDHSAGEDVRALGECLLALDGIAAGVTR